MQPKAEVSAEMATDDELEKKKDDMEMISKMIILHSYLW